MQKQAPTLGRLLTMVIFALSCFGLLLFLWLSFGGPVPLKPEGYRFTVGMPQATQLGIEAEVRVAGVPVGKVRHKELDPRGNRTLATVEVDERFAPIARDARAILRQKTLLGETYIELTAGTPGGPRLPEGARLADARVEPTVELDELLDALDPRTRQAFRTWQQDLAAGVRGRGRDLSDALGNLPRFAADASDLLGVLDTQEGAVGRLVKNTGVVFGALNENEAQLRNLVVNAGDVFDATASENEALARTFAIFPTFLDESRVTLARLRTFSADTNPLISDLRPVARDLRPTVRDVRALAPDLRDFFRDLDPLIKVSRRGLPALGDTLRGAKPLLAELGPFLSQLNPILEWLEYNQRATADFISNGAGALADTTSTLSGAERGHYLRQLGPVGVESSAIFQSRLPSHRGNSYPDPTALSGERNARMIFPSLDCANAGGERTTAKRGTRDPASCFIKNYPGFSDKFPRIGAASYARPGGK
ncbi:MAG: MCE family protein [Solirubrobacterales bacterium]|nr:MCE family protein [Solirubrobacterales bacterium]